jgi:hypothetical protein
MFDDKCFVLSLHRTGTRSTAALLSHLGLKVAHYVTEHGGADLRAAIRGREADHSHVLDVFRPVIDDVDAVADVPMPVLYETLAAAYPSARFVLLHRDPFDWALSVRRLKRSLPLDEFERTQFWHYFPAQPDGLRKISNRQLCRMHTLHTERVIEFFARRDDRQRLLVAPLASTDTAEKIARFLGLRPLQTAMPHEGSKTEKFSRRVRGAAAALLSRPLPDRTVGPC